MADDAAQLIEAGFTPESVAAAMAADDMTLLRHSGNVEGATALPKVALAYVHGDAGRVTAFEDSLMALRDWDANHSGFLSQRFAMRFGTDGLVGARNQTAARFIASDCDWLLWVDTDMGFEPDSLDRLLQVADPQARPIVGGLCFAARQYAHDGMNGYWTRPQPTLYDWRDNPDGGSGFVISPMYPVNALMKVAATGSAFILIHRTVFERIAETVPPDAEDKIGPHWYDRTPAPNGEILGEDISFCVRANLAGIPVYVYTGVRTSHYKGVWVQEKDHWRAYNPPPATEEVAVIVPVMSRWKNAEPFMRSLRASTGLAHVYAVADSSDDAVIRAWEDAGATVLVDNLVTFAKKVNLGFSKTTEPWIFVCGDDAKFHPGWLDHAQHVANVLNASVVGANGLGNQRELRGEHSGHLLIRRSYVDEAGASWDGPGIVCHEGYRHNFVDDEIVTTARQRGVFQMALGSVVEHLHPIWGKAEEDDVYRLGHSSWETDWELFKTRLEANS